MKGVCMEKSVFGRLENIIYLAKEGKHIQASINLKKKIVTPTVNPEEPGDAKSDNNMYLLIGEYSFTVAGEAHIVSKVYAFGTFTHSRDSLEQNMHFANERLKIDYKRLKEVKIQFEEKYF
jgi:hypothetical protein